MGVRGEMICRYCGRTGRSSVFIRMHDGTHRCDDALHCQHRIRKRQRLGTYDDHQVWSDT